MTRGKWISERPRNEEWNKTKEKEIQNRSSKQKTPAVTVGCYHCEIPFNLSGQ
jgi:hypothetical protein